MIVLTRKYDLLKEDYSGAPYNGFICSNNLFGVLVAKGGREQTCNDLYYDIKRRTK